MCFGGPRGRARNLEFQKAKMGLKSGVAVSFRLRCRSNVTVLATKDSNPRKEKFSSDRQERRSIRDTKNDMPPCLVLLSSFPCLLSLGIL